MLTYCWQCRVPRWTWNDLDTFGNDWISFLSIEGKGPHAKDIVLPTKKCDEFECEGGSKIKNSKADAS